MIYVTGDLHGGVSSYHITSINFKSAIQRYQKAPTNYHDLSETIMD